MTDPDATKKRPRADGRAVVRWAVLGAAAAGALLAGPAAAGGRAVDGAAAAPAPTATAAPSVLQPETLAQAQAIRAQTDGRYRRVPGRKLAVAEASSMGQVGSLTLATGGPEIFRVVATDNGVYFSICPARSSCPHPARSSSWPAAASLPRRQALELAVRTFRETTATLVVVALPTATPLWVVFERHDLLADAAAEAPLVHLDDDPAVADRLLRESVDRLVRPRLHRPVPILPPTLDTIVAIPTGAGENGAKARERYRSRIVRVLRMDDLRPQPGRSPRFEGHEHGASVSLFVVDLPEGRGPGPHRHPYEETFVILSGSASFTVDGETVEAGTGTIVVVPAGAVHGFAAGRDGMRSVNIHGSPRMEQVDLPPP